MQTSDSTVPMIQTAKEKAPYRETKRLKAPQRRRLILNAAQSILLSQGFAALTLRNTAEAADIRLATLQYYFPNREQLFQSAFQDIAEQAWAELMEQLDKGVEGNPDRRLRDFLSGLCGTTANDPLAGAFTELWAAARTHDFASTIMHSYYAQAVTLLATLIRDANPTYKPKESKQRAVLIIAMLEGLTLFNQMDSRADRRPSVSQKQALASMLALVPPSNEF